MDLYKARANAIGQYLEIQLDIFKTVQERANAGLPVGNLPEVMRWYTKRIARLQKRQNRENFNGYNYWI